MRPMIVPSARSSITGRRPISPAIRHAVVLLLLLLIVERAEAQSSEMTTSAGHPPNILWISVEDIGPYLGAYGDDQAQTPVLDRLAEQGMTFTRAFTTAGVCAPSRAAIITGMHQSAFGAHHMRVTHEAPGLPTPYLVVPPPYVKTFTEYLRAAGYYTTNNAKTDYQFGRGPRQPLTAWDESGPEAHWRNAPEGQPFFSVINLMTTHESQLWADPDRPLTVDPSDVEVPPYYPDTPTVRRDIARQYSNIARMDEQVGSILSELEAAGLAQSTVVFFWSDHGGALPRGKRWIYDSGIHVPLIVRWPGVVAPNSVFDELVSLVDLGPTVLSIAGIDVPGHMHGRPFLGAKKTAPREYVYAARDRHDEAYDMVRAVRDRRYKYIRNFYPNEPYVKWIEYRNTLPMMQEMLLLNAEGKLEGPQQLWFSNRRPVDELYDTDADPHEVVNLAADPAHQTTLERMSRELDRWMGDIADMGRIPEDELAERFWPGGEQPITDDPFFIVYSDENRRGEMRSDGGSFTAPVTVELLSTTHGASIAYTLDDAENPHWHLYTGRLRIEEPTTIRARAVRYGYAESDETVGSFTIMAAQE
ncbi:MAG: sulfatase-like hydrolase/transferase [Bacteroidota bacterium]